MPQIMPYIPPFLPPRDADGAAVSEAAIRNVLHLLEHTIALAFYVIQQSAPSERRARHLTCIAMARGQIETALEEEDA